MAQLIWQSALCISLGISASLVAQPAQARGKCDAPQNRIDVRACAAAAEGPDTLRRFVERTRAIYGLYFWDYVQDDVPKPLTDKGR